MKQIKTLGLASIAALALTALFGVSSASAQFQSENANTGWQATPVGEILIEAAGTTACGEATMTGETTGSKSTNELHLTPELAGCSYKGSNGLSWAMNGCKFALHLDGSEANVGTLTIADCEPAMKITNGGWFPLEIGNQEALAEVSYSTAGSGSHREVVANMSISGIKYTASGNEYENGRLSGEWKLKGSDPSSGEQVGVWAAPHTGPSLFRSEQPDPVLAGTQLSTQALTAAGKKLECYGANPSGEIEGVASGFALLHPGLNECEFLGVAPSLDMGGCSFALESDKGTASIVGTNCESEPIEYEARALGGLISCKVTIGPQNSLGEVSYANSGVWTGRRLTASFDLSGIEYTSTSHGGACEAGTFSNGTYEGELKLTAADSEGAQQGLWIE